MHHPQRIARLLQIGEGEVPGSVLWIDYVANPECERLAPDHDLIAGIHSEWTNPSLPPGVAHVIAIVESVKEMAKAGRPCTTINELASLCACPVVCAVE